MTTSSAMEHVFTSKSLLCFIVHAQKDRYTSMRVVTVFPTVSGCSTYQQLVAVMRKEAAAEGSEEEVCT